MEVNAIQEKKMRKRSEVKSMNHAEDFDPWTAWAYTPRTITLLFIGAFLLIWASGVFNPQVASSNDQIASTKRGIWAMIFVFLAYCLLQAPSTILIRPHPAIWRLVHGLAVIYLVALTFILFQDRNDARMFMKYLHPDLGVELPERSYGADCRIYVPENPQNSFINLYETMFDEFVLAHIFGWWAKAIMIRNQPLLWVLSIGFELMELTFRHMLPNFNECWWDSIILDILICNWFGIWAGMRTVHYFDGKTYEWVGLSRQPNIYGKNQDKRLESLLEELFYLQKEMPILLQNLLCIGKKSTPLLKHLPPFDQTKISWKDNNAVSLLKVKRTLSQFTPAQWDKDQWRPLLGPWRFVQVLSLCAVFMTVELNTFFLKFCLWIPPRNPLITYRLILWFLIAVPAIREYNSYLQDRHPLILSLHFLSRVLLFLIPPLILGCGCWFSKPLKKVGAFCWLSLAVCIVELLICVKFGRGLFPNSMPQWLVVFWISVGFFLSVFLALWTWHNHRSLARKRL